MAIVSTPKGILRKYPLIYYAAHKVHRFFFDLGWKLYRKSFSHPRRHVKALVSYAKEMINSKLVVDLGAAMGHIDKSFLG